VNDMVPRPRNGLSLCAGGGGLDMGLMLAEPGFHTRCFVEWEEYPRRAVIAAQRAGYFAPAPIWDDVTTFDGRPFRGAFDAVLAGYPCQPFSHAGQRRGADDERHLWPEVARIIREVEPEWVFLENVAGHVSLGAETVLRELWDMGWTPAAGLFSASETGAPHQRLRWFCVAYRDSDSDAGRLDSGRTGHGASQGEGECGERQRLRSGSGGGSDQLANPDGGHPGAERQQRGGEQRFQPEGGGTGASGYVGHPPRIGRGEGRAEHGVRSGRDTAPGSGGAMADACGAERKGKQPRQRDAGGRQEPDGHSALPRRTGIFPPGPGDAAAWADTLATAPYLAPATSLADCLAWARDMATALEGQDQAQAQSRLRGMAHGLAARSRALRLLGNGVVPLQAAYAWRTLAAAHGLGRVDLEAACGDAGADASEPVHGGSAMKPESAISAASLTGGHPADEKGDRQSSEPGVTATNPGRRSLAPMAAGNASATSASSSATALRSCRRLGGLTRW